MSEVSADGTTTTVLALPGRIHLINRGTAIVYLGLRFADRCAFDYDLSGPLESDDSDTSALPLIIEAPGCPCHPACDDCVTSLCNSQSCSEFCDERPPLLNPGDERVLPWDGSTFEYTVACGSARCANASTATPGPYQLVVPLYDRAVTPDMGVAPARTVTARFDVSGGGAGEADIEIAIGF